MIWQNTYVVIKIGYACLELKKPKNPPKKAQLLGRCLSRDLSIYWDNLFKIMC